MHIGIVGLGKMGGNMALRLLEHGHRVVAFDLAPAAVEEIGRRDGATPVESLEGLVAALEPPRIVWLMVPAGEPTEQTLFALG
ncbi:MAG TPA: NAD(P)-binding domain-containing protein, partial [Longimicrobiaceae bacterium]|nr:NAD(P)-binding domain-containing protein [Longimicrobiaceae bacterium]